MNLSINEHVGAVLNVPGRFYPAHAWDVNRWSTQKWISERRPIKGYGAGGEMQVEMRFDDNCKNGHNTFSITADITTTESRRRRDIAAGGCMHDEIARIFPELEPLINWHLCSTDGPLHYIANTVYLAGDRDHNGKRAGEPWSWDHAVKIGNSPITHRIKKSFWEWLKARMPEYRDPRADGEFLLQSVHHRKRAGETYDYAPRYTFVGYADESWADAPFKDSEVAREWADALNDPRISVEFLAVPTLFSSGKPRDLNGARNAAIWPDATDAQLTAEPAELRAMLEARLPGLLADFQAAITGAGFAWTPGAGEA
jgi:hypothetical protein